MGGEVMDMEDGFSLLIQHLNNHYSCFGISIWGSLDTMGTFIRGPQFTIEYQGRSCTRSIFRIEWDDANARYDMDKIFALINDLVNKCMETICKNFPPSLPRGRNEYLTYMPPAPKEIQLIPKEYLDRIASALLHEIELTKKDLDRRRVPAFCYPNFTELLDKRLEIINFLKSLKTTDS
jgi:hypothetical protein